MLNPIYQGPVGPLLAALKDLKRLISARTYIPALASAKVHLTTEGHAAITATDLDAELTIVLPDTIISGTFLIPVGPVLAGLTGESATDLVTITLRQPAADENVADIAVGSFSFTVDSLPVVDFPETLAPASGTATQSYAPVVATDLRAALAAVQVAISTGETRYYLNGAYMHAAPDKRLRIVSTDGHKLMMADINGADWTGPGLIFPRASIAYLMPMLKATRPSFIVTLLGYGETRIVVEGDGWTLTTKVIDGRFPDYTRALPRTAEHRVGLDCGEIIAACKKLGRLSDERSTALAIDTEAQVVRAAKAKVAVTLQNLEPTDPPTVGVNAAYLSETLAHMGDRALVAINGSGDPMRIEPTESPAFGDLTAVIMPMRV
jgi:DNA polymerase-3 subunit beta